MKSKFLILLCFCLIGSVAVGGCKPAVNPDKMFSKAVDTNAKRLGTMYTQFQTQNVQTGFMGPKDKDEFVAFIKKQNPVHLARIGIDWNDLDTLFVSERDNQPYKIRWEVQSESRGPAQPVVFEQTGVDGQFVVGFTGFMQKTVDKSEYDRLWAEGANSESE